MRAVILAAGRGARLEPITRCVHKCMIPFAGKPFLAWSLESLARSGVVDGVSVSIPCGCAS